jgi:hypothetical protein
MVADPPKMPAVKAATNRRSTTTVAAQPAGQAGKHGRDDPHHPDHDQGVSAASVLGKQHPRGLARCRLSEVDDGDSYGPTAIG